MQKITCKINEFNELLAQEQAEITKRKEVIEQDKQAIMSIKTQNEAEAKHFREEVSSVRTNLGVSNAGSQMLKRKS